MLERNLQKSIQVVSERNGIISVKLDSMTSRGWPDLTLILPTGTVLFMEVKSSTGSLSELQKYMHEKIKRNNANVYTIRTYGEFVSIVESYGIEIRPAKSD